MNHWNHRVIRKEQTDVAGQTWVSFGIHEVYYNDKNEPVACTENAVDPHGETLEELQEVMQWFAQALEKPVLTFDDIGKTDDDMFRELVDDIDLDDTEPF